MLYICSTSEVDDETGEPLYWSDKYGWVELSEASEYTQEQANAVEHLPADSYWC